MDRKKEIENLLSSLSEEDLNTLKRILEGSQQSVSQKPPKKRRRRGRGKKKKNKKSSSPTVSNFLDGIELSPSEAKELKDAGASDKEAGIHQTKERRMPKVTRASKIEATCRVCGSKELISPALMTPEQNRYKCNKCSCSAG